MTMSSSSSSSAPRERGYTARKMGRPYRSPAPPGVSQSVTIRLNPEELECVSQHVTQSGIARAELVRQAMEAFGLFSRKRLPVVVE